MARLVPTADLAQHYEDDRDVAAYMHRLRWLNVDSRRRLSDYPGFDGH